MHFIRLCVMKEMMKYYTVLLLESKGHNMNFTVKSFPSTHSFILSLSLSQTQWT